MARVAVWLSGFWAAHPLLAAPAAGRLRGGMGAFARMLRHLTRRGCPSAARQRVASSTAHPATAPTQVCPVATRRGRRLWVAFLLGTFLWRSKEQVPRPPGRDPASGLKKSTPSTTKTIATSALQISARAQKHQKKHTPARRLKPNPYTGPNAIRPEAAAWSAWRVSTRLRPARLAS